MRLSGPSLAFVAVAAIGLGMFAAERVASQRLAALWHNWQWFAKHIWNEDVEIPLPADEEESKR